MKVKLYVLEPHGQMKQLEMLYEDYIQPAILWATEDTKSLAKALDVVRVVAAGGYMSGLFGGEKKSGMEQYAGLVVSDLKPADGGFYIRLYNTDREYFVPSELMRRHGVDIYKAYYLGTINPFKCSALNVILSLIGEDKLKTFIRELIQINKKAMTEADERRLRGLAEEVKVRTKLLNHTFYVIYRNDGTFTSCVPEDLNKVVGEPHTAYIECTSAEQAHYYAAALNYMAYKVINNKRRFIRHYFAKPLLALVVAGFTWKDLPSELRSEIARLSYTLSKRLTWVDYPNQKKALLEVAKTPEFIRIIELLDKHVEEAGKQEMLNEALNFVAAHSAQELSGAAGGI